jgi:hypothetical protein
MGGGRKFVFVAAWLGLAGTVSFCFGASSINRSAQSLAKLLKPSALSQKVGGSDFEAAKAQVIKIIRALEETKRGAGPAPDDLLETAWGFRDDVGKVRRVVAQSALIRAWEEARVLGLFDEEGEFTGEITRGPDQGQKAVFEYIVPADRAPHFSRDYANIRIVAPSEARREGGAITPGDEVALGQLTRIYEESEAKEAHDVLEKAAPLNEIGETAREEREEFARELEVAGDAAKALPSVRVEGRVTATPSHLSGNRWRVSLDVSNLSRHPTEVEVEYFLFGITDEKRQHYLMATGKEKMQLRELQVAELDVFTKAENSYKGKAAELDKLGKKDRKKAKVRYRGFAVRINHAEGVAGCFATDAHLLHYVAGDDEELSLESIPKF